MRYAQGGGLTAVQRDKREQVRLAAAERFAEGEPVWRSCRLAILSVLAKVVGWPESSLGRNGHGEPRP